MIDSSDDVHKKFTSWKFKKSEALDRTVNSIASYSAILKQNN